MIYKVMITALTAIMISAVLIFGGWRVSALERSSDELRSACERRTETYAFVCEYKKAARKVLLCKEDGTCVKKQLEKSFSDVIIDAEKQTTSQFFSLGLFIMAFLVFGGVIFCITKGV